MISNIDDFVRYIPTARGTSFEDIFPFLEEAKMWAEDQLFGQDIVAEADKAEADEALSRSMNSIISLKAYAGAIPFLDVVQTPNGFAVVSNGSQAPASKERVERLLAYVNERLYSHVDTLIEYIERKPLLGIWKGFYRFEYLTEILFWSGTDFASFAGDYEKIETIASTAKISYKGGASSQHEAQRRKTPFLELQRLHVLIKGYQDEERSNAISRDFMQHLIDVRRAGTATADEVGIISKLKFITGLFFQDDTFRAQEQLDGIVNRMIANPLKFPIYADSDEYRLKITQRYQNLATDTTYFFG